MMRSAILRGIVFASCLAITVLCNAQAKPLRSNDGGNTKASTTKPFRVLTNGKKITIQGTSNISKILVWTASGYRIVEQTDLGTTNYSFVVTVKERILFLLLEFVNGKRYTEKIGVK